MLTAANRIQGLNRHGKRHHQDVQFQSVFTEDIGGSITNQGKNVRMDE